MNCVICNQKLGNPVMFTCFICPSTCEQKSACMTCASDYLQQKNPSCPTCKAMLRSNISFKRSHLRRETQKTTSKETYIRLLDMWRMSDTNKEQTGECLLDYKCKKCTYEADTQFAMESHFNMECPFGFSVCEYCHKKVKRQAIVDRSHYEACGSVPKCKLCKHPSLPDTPHKCVYGKCGLCNQEKPKDDKNFWKDHLMDHMNKLKTLMRELDIDIKI